MKSRFFESIIALAILISTGLVIAVKAGDEPRQDNAVQQAVKGGQDEARIGDGIREMRETARQMDIAAQKLNRLLDRVNGGLDRIEEGGIIIRIEMAPLARAMPSPKK